MALRNAALLALSTLVATTLPSVALACDKYYSSSFTPFDLLHFLTTLRLYEAVILAPTAMVLFGLPAWVVHSYAERAFPTLSLRRWWWYAGLVTVSAAAALTAPSMIFAIDGLIALSAGAVLAVAFGWSCLFLCLPVLGLLAARRKQRRQAGG